MAVVTLTGLALSYSMVFISYYLKRVHPIKTTLSFLGANTLDILLLHFGIAELICMIFGFWVPVYDVTYPAELFTWGHFVLVIILTAVLVLGFLFVKKRIKKNTIRN